MVSVTPLIGDSVVEVQAEWPRLVSCICSFNFHHRESQFYCYRNTKNLILAHTNIITVLSHPWLVLYKTIATVFSF